MCNTCNQTTPRPATCDPCGKSAEFCGCPTKIDAKCVIFDSCALLPLGVLRGDNYEEVVKQINNLFSSYDTKIANAFIGTNIGRASEVYKGVNSQGIQEFRTIIKGTGIVVTQSAETISISVDEVWVKNFIVQTINEPWFITFLSQLLTQPWFNNIFITNLQSQGAQTYLNNLIDNRVTNTLNVIDICKLIEKCIPKPVPSIPHPPVMGDMSYTLPNRSVGVPTPQSDFLSRYFDIDGDALTAIEFTGGDFSGMTYSNAGVDTPLTTGVVVQKADLSKIKFTAKDQDAEYTQTLTIRAINNLGEKSV